MLIDLFDFMVSLGQRVIHIDPDFLFSVLKCIFRTHNMDMVQFKDIVIFHSPFLWPLPVKINFS